MKDFIEVTQQHSNAKVLLALSTIQRLEQLTYDGATNARIYYLDGQIRGGTGSLDTIESFAEVAQRIGQAQDS